MLGHGRRPGSVGISSMRTSCPSLIRAPVACRRLTKAASRSGTSGSATGQLPGSGPPVDGSTPRTPTERKWASSSSSRTLEVGTCVRRASHGASLATGGPPQGPRVPVEEPPPRLVAVGAEPEQRHERRFLGRPRGRGHLVPSPLGVCANVHAGDGVEPDALVVQVVEETANVADVAEPWCGARLCGTARCHRQAGSSRSTRRR